MSPKRHCVPSASLARRFRRLFCEQLEERTLLATNPSNVFAVFSGVVPSGGSTQIAVSLQNPADFTLPTGQMALGFIVKPTGNSTLVPNVVQVTQGGSVLTPVYSNANLSNGAGSITLVQLGASAYTLTVDGQNGSSGAFELDVTLPGDVDANGTVSTADGQQIKSMLAGKTAYNPAADANLDTVIDSFDVAQWTRNRNDATTIQPLNLTVSLTPKQIPLANGTLLTNVAGSSISGSVASSDVTVALGVNGSFGTSVAVTGGQFSLPVTLTEGSNAYQVEATDGFGQQTILNVPVTLDTTPPTLQLTGIQPSATNENLSLSGSVADGLSGVASLTAQLNSGATSAVAFDPTTGTFSTGTSLPLNGSADGAYTLHLRATDRAGNVTAQDVSFTLDTIPPIAPAFDLSGGSITPASLTVAHETSAARVSLQGQTDPNVKVTLLSTGQTALSSNTGVFQFPGVTLALGSNPFTVQAQDAAGNTSSYSVTITRIAATGGPNAVLVWNQATLNAIQTDGTDPLMSSRALAMVQAAVYDAVNNVEGTPAYYIAIAAPTDSSIDAAVDAAAHDVLGYLYPAQQATFDALLTSQLALLPSGQGTTDGETVGQAVGNAIIALRDNDGSRAYVDFEPGTAAGNWQPTAPMYAPGLDPQGGNMTPWAMTSANQFDPAGPPALTSQQWAAAVNQVESLGAVNSTTRTAAETTSAQFWNDGIGTDTPTGHWNAIAQTVAQQAGNSEADDARLFAELDVSMADAGIATWNTKYLYNSWRPITVIPSGGDGVNPAVTANPTWMPLLVTPNFPEYVSGHSAFSMAAATVLDSFFGDNVTFTTTEPTTTLSETYTSFQQAAQDAGMSRLYGGIHFLFSIQDGWTVGQEVAAWDLATFNVTTDITPPKVTLNNVLPSGASKTNVTITGAATDNLSGVASLQVQVDGGAYVPLSFNAATGNFSYTTAYALKGSADGSHTINFQATDAAGNVATPVPFTFTLDTQAPVLTITSPVAGSALVIGETLSGTATTNGAAIAALSYAFDGGTTMPAAFNSDGTFSQTLDLSRLAAGAHTLVVTAQDTAGNTTTQTVHLTLAAAIPLTVSSITPTDGSTDVGVTFRPEVTFSRPINSATLSSSNFYATDTTGTKIPATVVPSSDGTFAWLFFTNALPGGSYITVTVGGSPSAPIEASDGSVLDAADSGTPGSALTATFTTVSETAVPGTTLSGIVADPGPDDKPGTRDDVRAGPDGILGTADDIYLLPIANAEVYILGENQVVYTNAQGQFTLTSVPSGDVKLEIDGTTATNAPAGMYFPSMVMDLTIQPGVANTVMSAMGTPQEAAANATNLGVYLPRLQTSILTTLSTTQPTSVGVAGSSGLGLTPQQQQEVNLTVQPGTAIGMNGLPMSNVQVGIQHQCRPQIIKDMPSQISADGIDCSPMWLPIIPTPCLASRSSRCAR